MRRAEWPRGVDPKMVFSSIIILFYSVPLFFSIFLLTRFSKITLLIFSLIFYAWGEPIFLPLIIVMIVLNLRLDLLFEAGQANGRAKLWITIGIGVNLCPLVVFQ